MTKTSDAKSPLIWNIDLVCTPSKLDFKEEELAELKLDETFIVNVSQEKSEDDHSQKLSS